MGVTHEAHATHEETLGRLQAEASRFGTDPYLLTVTADHEPHCSLVAVDWDVDGGRLVVRAPRSWAGSESSGHRQVSLLWPPPQPGGHSLIVNGLAAWSDGADGDRLAVVPTRAVLHRTGSPSSPGSSCASDCVPILAR